MGSRLVAGACLLPGVCWRAWLVPVTGPTTIFNSNSFGKPTNEKCDTCKVEASYDRVWCPECIENLLSSEKGKQYL